MDAMDCARALSDMTMVDPATVPLARNGVQMLPIDPASIERQGDDAASSAPNGQRSVRHDHTRNARHPTASTPTPNRITSSWVVAKTKIHPSSATRAGTG